MSQLNYAHKLARWFESNPNITPESLERMVGCFESLQKDLKKPKNLSQLKYKYGDKAYTCINKFKIVFDAESFRKGIQELNLGEQRTTQVLALLNDVLTRIKQLQEIGYATTSSRKNRQSHR